LATGTSIENIDWHSAGISGLAGLAGGGLANITSKQGLRIFTEFGQDVIGNTIAGIVAGGLDVYAQGSGK